MTWTGEGTVAPPSCSYVRQQCVATCGYVQLRVANALVLLTASRRHSLPTICVFCQVGGVVLRPHRVALLV